MNQTETEAAVKPIAEAIRGYMRDRTLLVEKRNEVAWSWEGRDKLISEISLEIKMIDLLVAAILSEDQKRKATHVQ